MDEEGLTTNRAKEPPPPADGEPPSRLTPPDHIGEVTTPKTARTVPSPTSPVILDEPQDASIPPVSFSPSQEKPLEEAVEIVFGSESDSNVDMESSDHSRDSMAIDHDDQEESDVEIVEIQRTTTTATPFDETVVPDYDDDDAMEKYMGLLVNEHETHLNSEPVDKTGRPSQSHNCAFNSNGTGSDDNQSQRYRAVMNKQFDDSNRLQYQRPQMARYDLQFTIMPSDEPEMEISEQIQEILHKVQSEDNRIVIYPWKTTDGLGIQPKAPPIRSKDPFPTDMAALKMYFPGLRPKYEGGTIYTSVCMGSGKKLEQIMESIGHWFKHNKAGIYLKHIQAQQEFTVGWLLYSQQSMDLARLQSELGKYIGLPVSARWQMINTGHNKDLRDEDKIKAVHLRVDAALQDEAVSKLSEIYSSSATKFPLLHCMRLIPTMDRMMNPANVVKFAELRNRQRNFGATMVRIQSWEVASLFSNRPTIPPVHTRLMGIASPSFHDQPMFHCVDKPSLRSPCIFWCHPEDETAARALVAGIIPYLRYMLRKTLNFPHFLKKKTTIWGVTYTDSLS